MSDYVDAGSGAAERMPVDAWLWPLVSTPFGRSLEFDFEILDRLPAEAKEPISPLTQITGQLLDLPDRNGPLRSSCDRCLKALADPQRVMNGCFGAQCTLGLKPLRVMLAAARSALSHREVLQELDADRGLRARAAALTRRRGARARCRQRRGHLGGAADPASSPSTPDQAAQRHTLRPARPRRGPFGLALSLSFAKRRERPDHQWQTRHPCVAQSHGDPS